MLTYAFCTGLLVLPACWLFSPKQMYGPLALAFYALPLTYLSVLLAALFLSGGADVRRRKLRAIGCVLGGTLLFAGGLTTGAIFLVPLVE